MSEWDAESFNWIKQQPQQQKPHVVISKDIIKWMEWVEKIATVATININATGKCCRKQDFVAIFFNAGKTFIAYGKMVIHIFLLVVVVVVLCPIDVTSNSSKNISCSNDTNA